MNLDPRDATPCKSRTYWLFEAKFLGVHTRDDRGELDSAKLMYLNLEAIVSVQWR